MSIYPDEGEWYDEFIDLESDIILGYNYFNGFIKRLDTKEIHAYIKFRYRNVRTYY